MRSSRIKLKRMFVKKFCAFSIIIVFIYAVVNIAVGKANDKIVYSLLKNQYQIDCEGKVDYASIDTTDLQKIGAWFEVLDLDRNVIYPSVSRQYTIDEMIDMVNGSYYRGGEAYYGKMSNFMDTKGHKQVQIIFFPCQIMNSTQTIKLPVGMSIVKYMGSFILGALVFAMGYIATVFVMTKNIKEKVMKPLNKLRFAMRELGRGNYKKRVYLEAKYEYEFVEMGKSFNQMAYAMEMAVKKKKKEEFLRRQLISDVGHDIRTPLTVIQGYLATVLNNIGEGNERRYLEKCYQSSLEMAHLLEQLIDYNRMLKVDYELKLEKTDLTEFIKTFLADQYDGISQAGLTLDVEVSDSERPVVIDVPEMRRVMTNLIQNAIQYNDKGTTIFVLLLDHPQRYEIIVADNGKKISEEIAPRIFEPFVRAEESRSCKEHSGLGLSIVKRIVERHGGQTKLKQPVKTYTKAFCIFLKK